MPPACGLPPGNEEIHDQPSYRGGEEERVEPIHDSTVPRQEGAHVLDPEISFDHRFNQVTAGTRSHQADTENDPHPKRDMKQEKGHADAGSCTEDQ